MDRSKKLATRHLDPATGCVDVVLDERSRSPGGSLKITRTGCNFAPPWVGWKHCGGLVQVHVLEIKKFECYLNGNVSASNE